MAREYHYFIGGDRRSSGERVDIVNPYGGDVAGTTFIADDNTVEEAVRASVDAFRETKALPAYRRAGILEGVVSGLGERAEEIASMITAESGKPINDARGEVKRAQNTFKLAAEEAKRLGGEVIPLDIAAGSEKRTAIVRRFPVGPLFAVSPFNFPLNLVAHKVAPAMAVGNSILLKPSPRTPLTAIILGEIIAEAGWPPGALNIFLCSNDMTGRVVEDDRVGMVSFTGSAAVGWSLKARAGRKKVALELGGNAAIVVHNDADMDYAVERALTGAFSFSGQVCISVQRIYVERECYDLFLEPFLKGAAALQSGDPMSDATRIGPLIDEAAAKKVEEWVKEAVDGGAEIALGGQRNGSFFAPTVLTGVRPDMRVSCSEVFGPLVVVEAYDDFDDALDAVNDSPYGLQAGIFTADIKRAFHAFDVLDVGGVVINDVPTYRVDNMPYGGVKESGFGREGVRYAMEEMTEQKLLVLNLK